MPVKQRRSKRRNRAIGGLDQWSMTFYSGYDFLHELPKELAGDAKNDPATYEAAREAWAEHGRAYMAQGLDETLPWAAREFGFPWEEADAGLLGKMHPST